MIYVALCSLLNAKSLLIKIGFDIPWDSLLEHFMPSLMALKKAMPGKQPGSFRESFISVECFYKVQKQKYIEWNLKTFSQKRSDWKLCIGEVRVDLVHLCSCSSEQCKKIHEVSHKNNYPLVQIHCIIKIMCQDLPLGCLHCLLVRAVQNRNFDCSA